MWHASVSFRYPRRAKEYRAMLRKVLHGVGIDTLQWIEEGRRGIWHCRRRLTPAEQDKCGAPLDVRGTVEHRARAERMAAILNITVEAAMEPG